MALVDHNGNPLPSNGTNGHVNPFASHADPKRIQPLPHVITFGSVWNAANKVYSWRWDEAYKTSREDALSMRRDAFLMGIVQERCLAVSNLNWHLEPEDGKDKRQKTCADYLTKIVQRQRKLPSMFYNLMDATWFGRYGAGLTFNWDGLGRPRGIPGPDKALVATSYYPVNGDKIQFGYQLPGAMSKDACDTDCPVIRIHTGYAGQIPKKQLVMTDAGMALKLDDPYWRERFIIHEHIPDDADFFQGEMAGGVHGVGIRSRLYWLDWIRKEFLSNIMDYIQRVGMGTVIFYFEAGNPESEDKAIRAANEMSQNSVIVWPRPIGQEKQGAGVERFDMPMSGSETLIKLMEWIEGIEERFIIGQSASSKSDAQGMGTHDSSAQMDTKYRITKFDANNLADTLTHDYIRVLQRWNCPQEPYLIRFVFDVDKPDAEKRMQALDKAYSFGVKLNVDDIYNTTGTSKPEEDAETVQNPQVKQQQLQLKQQEQQMAGGSQPGQLMGGPGALAEQPLPRPGTEDADVSSLVEQITGPMQFSRHNLTVIADLTEVGVSPQRAVAVGAGLAKDRRLTRDDLHYRLAANTDTSCGTCRFMRSGDQCGLFAALQDIGLDRYQLDPRVVEVAVCDAWSGRGKDQDHPPATSSVAWKGYQVVIETPKGAVRQGRDRNGTAWSVTMPADYGYLSWKRPGADGDHVDIFLGPDRESELVFVVDQINPETGEFDEHKIVAGTGSLDEAEALYLDAYSDGQGRLGAITPVTLPQFWAWLETGDLGESVQYAAKEWVEEKAPRAKSGKRWRSSKTGKVVYKEPGKGRAKKEPETAKGGAEAAAESAEPELAKLNRLEGSEKAIARTFRDLGVKTDDLPGLVGAGGAPPGSEVNATELSDGAWVTLKGDWGMAERTILNNGVIKNENIEISKKGQGIGTAIIADQVANAVKHGFREIRAFASGGPGDRDNGYYTWPRLGFDGELPESVLDRLPDRFMGEDIVMVSDLMKTKAGRDWWRYNGEPLSLSFDLRDGSKSRKVLDAYLKKSAKKPKAEPQAAAARKAPRPRPPTIEQVQSMLGDDKERNRSIAKSVLSIGGLEAAYEHFSDPDQFGADRLGRAMAEAIYLAPQSDAAHLVSRIAAPKPYAKAGEEDELGTLDLSPREEEALDAAWDKLILADGSLEVAKEMQGRGDRERALHAIDAAGKSIAHDFDPDEIDDLEADHEDRDTPKQFAVSEEPRHYDNPAEKWVEEDAPRAQGGKRWRNSQTGELTYEDPTGQSAPETEKTDVGRQAPATDEDSWVSISMNTQREKWRQKLASALHDYQLIRKRVRDTGATHQEIEADKGVLKAVKRVEAIRAKLGSLEGGEHELRAARDEMAEPMAAFAAGEITEEQLTQEVKPQIAKIAKVLGAGTTRKLFEKAKAAVNSDTFKTLQATWPARMASLVGTAEDWIKSSIMSEGGIPSLGAWIASYVIVRGLEVIKKKLGKGQPMLENKPQQHARDDQVPPEMVDLMHKWLGEMAAAAGIEPLTREQVAAKLADPRHPEQYAKAEAERQEKRDDTALLASLLGGYTLDGWVFVPTERKDRFLRAKVVRATSDRITGPENCENVIVSDDRAGRKHDLYYRFGAGDFDLSEATPIDPSEGPGALLKLIREERPRGPDPYHPCPED